MTYILSYLLWSCLLFALFYITGCVVDWLILSRVCSVGADGLTRITLGMTFWMAFLFAVAALGLLYSLTIALAAFGAVAAFGVLAIRSGKQTIAPRLGRFCSPPRSHLLFLAPLVAMLTVLFVLALSPKVIGWDADTYHLTVPINIKKQDSKEVLRFEVWEIVKGDERLIVSIKDLWRSSKDNASGEKLTSYNLDLKNRSLNVVFLSPAATFKLRVIKKGGGMIVWAYCPASCANCHRASRFPTWDGIR